MAGWLFLGSSALLSPACRCANYQFILSRLQIHPSLPSFVILDLDPGNMPLLPAGPRLGSSIEDVGGTSQGHNGRKRLPFWVLVLCFKFSLRACACHRPLQPHSQAMLFNPGCVLRQVSTRWPPLQISSGRLSLPSLFAAVPWQPSLKRMCGMCVSLS